MTSTTEAPEETALTKIENRALINSTGLYIDGKWRTASNGESFDVVNPANGESLATVASAGIEDAYAAVSAAYEAGGAWSARPAKERSAMLAKWHSLIIENRDDLALLMTLEQGKPLAEARGEVVFGASFVSWYAEEAKRVYGQVLQTYNADRRVLILRQAIGVVVAITPWNFPSAMITRKCAPALAAGCTIVLKPSEDTPLSAIALVALAEQAGIPAGVINLLPASRANSMLIGAELLADTRVRKLSFTGSTQTGKQLMRLAADNVLKISLELGGNAPFIVFEDADLDKAVAGALNSKFRNMGQTCTCANRFFIHKSIYAEFAHRLTKKVLELTVGNGIDPEITQGPLINQRAVDKVAAHISDAIAQGAVVAAGGKIAREGTLYFQPTILTDVTSSMRICQEETFGPVAPLIPFDSEEEVIRLANQTRYGLAGYFFTRDLNRAFRVAEKLELGAVGVNEAVISSESVPIGGVKESGIGREGASQGIEDFLETKQITIGGM